MILQHTIGGTMNLEEAKLKARNLDVMLRIGKNGLNEGMINEILIKLKKKKMVKIKMLISSLKEEKKKIIEELVNKTKSTILHQIGNVVVLWNGK